MRVVEMTVPDKGSRKNALVVGVVETVFTTEVMLQLSTYEMNAS
jgi:hypothetical protein